MSTQIAKNTTIYQRPHYGLESNQLFFLQSRRPMNQLSDQEVAVWQALDVNPTMDTLRSHFGHEVEEIIAKFCQIGVCDKIKNAV